MQQGQGIRKQPINPQRKKKKNNNNTNKNKNNNNNEKYSPQKIRQLLQAYNKKEIDVLQDDDKIIKIYKALHQLNDADKIIFLLYADSGSLRATGRLLGVSYSTARKAIMEIKNKLLNILEKL